MNSTRNEGVITRAAPRWRALALVLALVTAVASCSRSDDEQQTGGDDEQTTDNGASSGDSRVANGEFGDMGVVCQDGDGGAGSGETGLTADEIHIGVVTDQGAQERPGLNKDMYDVSVAFADWCNEHGGINGRNIVVDDLDAKLFEYPARIATACTDDFALVAGGAVFDNADAGARVNCGLPNIPGFVVTPEARVADLQVQPVPLSVQQFPVQQYQAMQTLFPDATNFGVMWVDLAGVKTVHDQLVEAVETLGFDVVYDQTYAPIGETGWRSFVQSMRDAGVQGFELVGEPENMTALLQAMQTEGWYPDFITLQPNMVAQKFEDEAAASADGGAIYTRVSFPTFDMADEFPAMSDYSELMQLYNAGGTFPTLLGAQALSSWLLFAQSAIACGADLSRTCLLDNAGATTEWTGGGLHAPTTPGNTDAPDCGALLQFTTDGFQYDEAVTAPDNGIYNCDPANILELTGDYGVAPAEE